VLARCFADTAVEAVLVDPLAVNVRAHRFYERLGFRFVGPRTFGADACSVYRLERSEYLQQIETGEVVRSRTDADAGRIDARTSGEEERVMFDHIGFGVTDLEASKAFFLKALAPLGVEVVMEGPYGVGIGSKRKPSLWLHAAKGTPAPLHLAFAAPSRRAVDVFHAAAIAAGGRDNGPPGLRPHYHANYYGAFVIGPDGHNIEAVCHQPES
jgi:catechol 2,3-dioxygenase-like lactoylglutathione lyase family enzyme